MVRIQYKKNRYIFINCYCFSVGSCQLTVNKCSDDVCQLRYIFLGLNLLYKCYWLGVLLSVTLFFCLYYQGGQIFIRSGEKFTFIHFSLLPLPLCKFPPLLYFHSLFFSSYYFSDKLYYVISDYSLLSGSYTKWSKDL